MTHSEQIDAFQRDLNNVVSRYRQEFELNLADAIGTLEIVKLDLWKEQNDIREEGYPTT